MIVPTFMEAANAVHLEHKVAWKNGKHQAQWINTLDTYAFPKLGKLLVSEIDLAGTVWVIPAERMKAGKDHRVPLSDSALDALERVAPFKSEVSDLVFPGQKPKNPLSDMTLLKVLQVMDVPGTVHGFRSSFRDWCAEATICPSKVAEAARAHAIPNKVEAANRRTDVFEKRRHLMAEWATFCTSSELRS